MTLAAKLEFAVRAAEWSYDAILRRPIFRLARDGAQILEAFYDALSPQVPLAPNSMSLCGGTTLSDIRLRVQLFGGAGSLELTADRFSSSFRTINSQSEIDLAIRCSSLGRQALERVIHRSDVRLDSFAIRGHLELVGGGSQAQQLLSRFSITPDGLKDLVPGPVRGGIHLDLSEASSGWICAFDIQASTMIDGGLFWALSCSYAEDCPYEDFTGRQEHFLSLARALPAAYGLIAKHEAVASRSKSL